MPSAPKNPNIEDILRLSPMQELMLLHEVEHCKAGDARLIGVALLLRILVPWNLPFW